MIKTDYHMHTSYSLDASSSMEEMIAQAVNIGMTEICFTDHYEFEVLKTKDSYTIDYDKYVNEFNQLKEKYSNKINLMLGIELGLIETAGDDIRKLIEKYNFDFTIGSSHIICGDDLYLKKLYENRAKKEAYQIYFEETLKNILAIDGICVYGHLDYVSRYAPYPNKLFVYEEFSDVIDEVLKALISKNIGLEINTSGFRYGLNQTHPHVSILKRYKEFGGKIVTVGSDSHHKKDVAAGFDKAYEVLTAAGFDSVALFRERKPTFIKIT